METFLAEWGFVVLQSSVDLQIAVPDLLHEQVIDDLACCDELGQGGRVTA